MQWFGWVQRNVGTSVIAATFALAPGCHSNPADFPPRVVMTTSRVVRVDGPSALTPTRAGVLVYTPAKDYAATKKKAEARGMGKLYPDDLKVLSWRGEPLSLEDIGDTMLLKTPARVLARISLKGMPYVHAAYAVTAPLDGTGEWLAVLIRHRATSPRELFVLIDPAGRLVHQELLARPSGFRAQLWASGTGISRSSA